MKVLAIALLFATEVFAASNWPQFRGPNGTGVSPDAKPPQTFSKTNNVLWSTDLPYSPSSPCVSGDQIFVTTFDARKFQLRSYRRSDGEFAWGRGFNVPMVEDYH